LQETSARTGEEMEVMTLGMIPSIRNIRMIVGFEKEQQRW
jgi:hypothetical protein